MARRPSSRRLPGRPPGSAGPGPNAGRPDAGAVRTSASRAAPGPGGVRSTPASRRFQRTTTVPCRRRQPAGNSRRRPCRASRRPAGGAAPGGPQEPRSGQIVLSPPGRSFVVGGGPYTVPIDHVGASQISSVTLTITYNPSTLRVRAVQEGSFMRWRRGGHVHPTGRCCDRPHRYRNRANR